MKSLILQTITRFLLSWMLLFSLWVLFRGHNAPGGGFIGGLMAAASLSLYLLAYGIERLQQIIRFSPLIWLGLGLVLMLFSGVWGIFAGVFLKSVLINNTAGLLHSSLLFDIGLYIVVCFSILSILMALERTP